MSLELLRGPLDFFNLLLNFLRLFESLRNLLLHGFALLSCDFFGLFAFVALSFSQAVDERNQALDGNRNYSDVVAGVHKHDDLSAANDLYLLIFHGDRRVLAHKKADVVVDALKVVVELVDVPLRDLLLVFELHRDRNVVVVHQNVVAVAGLARVLDVVQRAEAALSAVDEALLVTFSETVRSLHLRLRLHYLHCLHRLQRRVQQFVVRHADFLHLSDLQRGDFAHTLLLLFDVLHALLKRAYVRAFLGLDFAQYSDGVVFLLARMQYLAQVENEASDKRNAVFRQQKQMLLVTLKFDCNARHVYVYKCWVAQNGAAECAQSSEAAEVRQQKAAKQQNKCAAARSSESAAAKSSEAAKQRSSKINVEQRKAAKGNVNKFSNQHK